MKYLLRILIMLVYQICLGLTIAIEWEIWKEIVVFILPLCFTGSILFQLYDKYVKQDE